MAFWGLHAAANRFFGREVENLSVAEAAMLAGLVRAPWRYDPTCFPDRALVRRGWVLRHMREEKLISDEQFKVAFREPLVVLPRLSPCPED